jgi:hypothetical protein
VVQFGQEASKTRDYRVARSATPRAARPDPWLRKERYGAISLTAEQLDTIIGELSQFGKSLVDLMSQLWEKETGIEIVEAQKKQSN